MHVCIRVRIRISVELDNEKNLVLELIASYQQSRYQGQIGPECMYACMYNVRV